MSNMGKLFLIPTTIAAETNDFVIPPNVRLGLAGIRHFLVEDVRTARRYLSSLKIYDTVENISFSLLTKDTREQEMEALFQPLRNGNDLGVLSESGCPGIADPGALAAGYAHRHGVRVIPLVGPSSIFLALMASGLNGQRFAFHGYLPIQGADASKAIRELERESRTRDQTQIFIETPYRNNNLLKHLIKNLAPQTRLCLAVDVTGANEFIATKTVAEWRGESHELPKLPAVFLFLA